MRDGEASVSPMEKLDLAGSLEHKLEVRDRLNLAGSVELGVSARGLGPGWGLGPRVCTSGGALEGNGKMLRGNSAMLAAPSSRCGGRALNVATKALALKASAPSGERKQPGAVGACGETNVSQKVKNTSRPARGGGGGSGT